MKNTKRNSITDVAREAGVSVYSVSITLNRKAEGKVSEKVQQRIFEAAGKLNYVRHRDARNLKSGSSYKASLLVYGSLVDYRIIGWFSFYEAIATIADTLNEADYLLDIIQCERKLDEERLTSQILSAGSDGVLLRYWPNSVLSRIVPRMERANIPYVTLQKHRASSMCFYFDYRSAAQEAAKYLLRDGPRCLGVVFAEYDVVTHRRKLAGIDQAHKSAGRTALKTVTVSRPVSLSSGFDAAEELFREKPYPDKILVTDNLAISSLLFNMKMRRVRVPQDVEVLGIGDHSFAENNNPRFSYIPLKIEEIAQRAASALLKRIQGGVVEGIDYSPPIEIIHAETTNPG